MKVLVDTNVLLDVLCRRPDFVGASSQVWRYCETGIIEGYVSALSIPNIVYILRKELDPVKTQQIIRQLCLIFRVADLRASDITGAADIPASDYEDVLQMCQAHRIGADHIVTRNIRDFGDSKVPALAPSELLERI